MNKIENYNQSKHINTAIYIFVAIIVLFVLATCAQYYSVSLHLRNPLIPEVLVQMSLEPFIYKGTVLVIGLLLIFAFKYFKRNLVALAVAVFIILFYIFSNHYIGGWHTEIN